MSYFCLSVFYNKCQHQKLSAILVEQFERNIETYKRAQNETQVRRELKTELPQFKTPQSRTKLERQIAHTDSEIDRLVL
jgi:hypothetical protein